MKVKFVVSLPYNMAMTKSVGKEYNRKNLVRVIKWTNKFEKEWRKYEKKITTRIARYSGFKWKRNKVICFVVEKYPCTAISKPLTIRIYKNIKNRIRILTHELIHVNTPIKFGNLVAKSKRTRVFTHIAVYLILNKIMKEVFPKQRKYSKKELSNKIYRNAIEKSIELGPLWKRSGKNIYSFMKYCLEKGLVK